MKPSEILSKIKKSEWTTGKYSDENNSRFCFNGFIFNELLGCPEPRGGDMDMRVAYGYCGRLIHDVIADINDDNQHLSFTIKKNQAIAFLERKGL